MTESTTESRAEITEPKEQLTRHLPKALYKALLLQETRPQPASEPRRRPQPPLLSPGGFRTFRGRSRWFPQLPLLSPGGFHTFGRSFSIVFIVGSELGRTRW